jgi:hypothetical protein
MSLDERTGKLQKMTNPFLLIKKQSSNPLLTFVTEASSFNFSLFKGTNQELNSVILICIRI